MTAKKVWFIKYHQITTCFASENSFKNFHHIHFFVKFQLMNDPNTVAVTYI